MMRLYPIVVPSAIFCHVPSIKDSMMKDFNRHPKRWNLVDSNVGPATGGPYRGGISTYNQYQHIWSGDKLGIHTIIRNGKIIHGPHFFPW